MKPLVLSNDVLRLVYGNDIDTNKIKMLKTDDELWYDVILFLANDEILLKFQ